MMDWVGLSCLISETQKCRDSGYIIVRGLRLLVGWSGILGMLVEAGLSWKGLYEMQICKVSEYKDWKVSRFWRVGFFIG